jgi:hypothetical protein
VIVVVVVVVDSNDLDRTTKRFSPPFGVRKIFSGGELEWGRAV